MTVTNETAEAHDKAVAELERLLERGGNSSTHDAAIATAFQQWAQEKHILLTPCLALPRLRDGVEVSFSKMRINTAQAAKEVFQVGGDDGGYDKEWGAKTQLSFHATTLDKIASNLGIKWAKQERADDGNDGLRCEIVQYGFYMGVDLTPQPLIGRGEMRLHDDSARVQKILRQARSEAAARNKIEMQRDKIVQLTETNARERCIKSFGFRVSYSKEELDTKFIICMRPMITGYSEDPEIRRMFAQDAINQSRLAMSALYGESMLPLAPSAGLPPQISSGAPDRLALNEAPAKTESGEPSLNQNQCTPGNCLGMGATAHIKECFGVAEPEPEPWVIPQGRGPAAGMKINDGQVTPQILQSMRDFYVLMLEDKDTQPLTRQGLIEEQKFLEAEIKRRGLFEHAAKS